MKAHKKHPPTTASAQLVETFVISGVTPHAANEQLDGPPEISLDFCQFNKGPFTTMEIVSPPSAVYGEIDGKTGTIRPSSPIWSRRSDR